MIDLNRETQERARSLLLRATSCYYDNTSVLSAIAHFHRFLPIEEENEPKSVIARKEKVLLDILAKLKAKNIVDNNSVINHLNELEEDIERWEVLWAEFLSKKAREEIELKRDFFYGK